MTTDARTRITRPGAKRYGLSVSDPKRFIYVRTAKVATRSISAAFNNRPDLEVVMHRGRLRRWPQGEQRDYPAFGFVRNPFTKLVSCWQDKVVGTGRGTWRLTSVQDRSFEEFVTALEGMDILVGDRHVRPQVAAVPLDRLSFVGRFERLVPDWERVCEWLDLGEIPLPRENVSAVPAEPVRIEPALAARIVRLYELDFQMFGYSTEIPEKLR